MGEPDISLSGAVVALTSILILYIFIDARWITFLLIFFTQINKKSRKII